MVKAANFIRVTLYGFINFGKRVEALVILISQIYIAIN